MTCGFQSESKSTHVSAVWRFTPSPPARVDMRNRKTLDFGALNCAMSTERWQRLAEQLKSLGALDQVPDVTTIYRWKDQ